MSEEEKEFVRYRIRRAKETYLEVELLVDNQLWFAAINRLYYACFYAVNGLLYEHGIETKTHSGVINQFGLHFIKTGVIQKDLGDFYSDIFYKRHKSDYDDLVIMNGDIVLPLLEPARTLIDTIEKMLM